MTSTNTKRKRNQTETKMSNCCLVKLSGKVTVINFFLLIAILCVLYESAESVLIQTPKDATTVVNHSTFFNCSKSINNTSSDLEELTWDHQPLGGVFTDVYADKRIRDKYKGRFSIDKNVTSIPEDIPFNLLVVSPESKDAGRYRCVEDVLKADKGASAELIVLDSNLVCEPGDDLDEIVGPTECAKPIAPDQLRLQCSVTYSGNVPPQMEWRKVGSELVLNMTNCTSTSNRIMCNTTLEANIDMDGSVYTCQIKTAKQYNCSLKVNKVIYAFSKTSVRVVTTKEEVVCSANTSKDLPCSYKWYKGNKTEQLGQTLKTNDPGIYRCEAECKIRSETCAFTAMVIDVSDTAASVESTLNPNWLWLLVLIIAFLAIAAGLVYYFHKKNNKAIQKQADSTEEANVELMKKVDSNDALQRAFNKAIYIGKGLSRGEIHGPMLYEGKQCACERFTFTTGTHTIEGDMSKEEKICRNGQKWKALDHKNLIKFYHIVSRPSSVYVVMEYAAGRSVRDALKKFKDNEVNLPVVKDWATQIASGMEYLHGKDIVHKHLSSNQILLMESFERHDIQNKTLKISQFCLIEGDFTSTQADQKFSFRAPEVFDDTYEKEGDVWSFGIIVWEMLTKKQPYNDLKVLTKITADIKKGAELLEIPALCPEELRGILMECRMVDRSKRPSFSEILRRLQEMEIEYCMHTVTQQEHHDT